MMIFIEHPVFSRQIVELLTDEEYGRFQTELVRNPRTGDVIPGLFGLRKVRVATSGRGKRGGVRVIYLLLPEEDVIYLFYAYSKGDMLDLTPEQQRRFKQAVQTIKREFSI
jgi:hypothetical protein